MFAKLVRVLVLLLPLGICVHGEEDVGPEISRGVDSAIVPQKDVSALLGHPINISCFAKDNLPLQSCRWERIPPVNNKRYFVQLSRGNGGNSSGFNEYNCNCTYEYKGIGLDKGDCTLGISNVTEFHLTKWQCLLVSLKGSDTWTGNLQISPSHSHTVTEPYFKEPGMLQEIVYDATSKNGKNVTCCVDETDPNIPLTLNIYLANTITSPLNTTRKDEANRLFLRGNQACRTVRYTFFPEDNGRLIVCNVTYMLHTHQQYELITSLPLRVKYAPKLLDMVSQELISPDDRMELGLGFISNPQPYVTWRVVTDKENNASFEIREDHVKYRMSVKHLEGDRYTANLTILNFETEDYKRVFMINVTNEIGSVNRLSRIVSPPSGHEQDAYWLMIIFGIGGVILLVIFAIVVYIVLQNSRNKRRDYQVTPVKYSTRTEQTKKEEQGRSEAVELQ